MIRTQGHGYWPTTAAAVRASCAAPSIGPTHARRNLEDRYRALNQSAIHRANTKGSTGFPAEPFVQLALLKQNVCLLDLGLQVGGSAVRHIDLEFDLLALGGKRMPGHHFVLAGRHVLDLERTIFLHHGEVRIRHREEEGLHELMLVAL